MFQSARLKLTAWYLLIILFISVLFSLIIYQGTNEELERFKHFQEVRLERIQSGDEIAPPNDSDRDPAIEIEMVSNAQNRLRLTLLGINIFIIGVSGVIAYFLAGRTLKPIKEMVDEQNRFISDASHELRTPLTALRSEIEVYMRDKKLTLDEAKSLLTSNLEEVIHLQALSDELMQLTQYQKRSGNIIFETISLAEVANKAIHKIHPLAKVKNITIENNIKDHKVEASKQSIIDIFIIFIDNAIKYSDEKTTIHLSSQKIDGHIVIKIQDEGIGIEGKDLPHIFERFYRADKSRSKEKEGYGLGLSIAKRIIDLHNGSIRVESNIEKGTTFFIKLPIKHSNQLFN